MSAKGADYEREMCRTLSLWWSKGERDDLFWRSAGSGAMAKTRSKVGKDTAGQYGDITATDPLGMDLLEVFTIELKRGYNESTFTHMLDKPGSGAKQLWESFFDQVYLDHTNAGSRSWLLIWRRDRRRALIFSDVTVIIQLKAAGAALNLVPHLRGKVELKDGAKVNIFTCALDHFLEKVEPEHIRRLKR